MRWLAVSAQKRGWNDGFLLRRGPIRGCILCVCDRGNVWTEYTTKRKRKDGRADEIGANAKRSAMHGSMNDSSAGNSCGFRSGSDQQWNRSWARRGRLINNWRPPSDRYAVLQCTASVAESNSTESADPTWCRHTYVHATQHRVQVASGTQFRPIHCALTAPLGETCRTFKVVVEIIEITLLTVGRLKQRAALTAQWLRRNCALDEFRFV